MCAALMMFNLYIVCAVQCTARSNAAQSKVVARTQNSPPQTCQNASQDFCITRTDFNLDVYPEVVGRIRSSTPKTCQNASQDFCIVQGATCPPVHGFYHSAASGQRPAASGQRPGQRSSSGRVRMKYIQSPIEHVSKRVTGLLHRSPTDTYSRIRADIPFISDIC